MAVQAQRAALDPKDLATRGVQQAHRDELLDVAPGLERRVQGQPGLRPKQAAGDGPFDMAGYPPIADPKKALNKFSIVGDHPIAHREDVHATLFPRTAGGADVRRLTSLDPLACGMRPAENATPLYRPG
jgi:hypothetical protein